MVIGNYLKMVTHLEFCYFSALVLPFSKPSLIVHGIGTDNILRTGAPLKLQYKLNVVLCILISKLEWLIVLINLLQFSMRTITDLIPIFEK